MNLVKPKSSAHWYSRSGVAAHTVIGANGLERPATLRDARKLDLLPSVTSILSTLANPGLDAWKQSQAILAALTLPRREGETDDAFASRVVDDMGEEAKRAGEFGTRVHEAIELCNAGRETDPDLKPWLHPYREWKRAAILHKRDDGQPDIVSAEGVVVADHYAGRFDLLCRTPEGLTLIDFKTQKVKEKPRFYDSWGAQLAAYRAALPEMHRACRCVSVVINSITPAAPVEKVWSDEELTDGLDIFRHALAVWRIQRGIK